MINATLRNLLKAVGIAALVTCVFSGFYGIAGLMFGFLEDSETVNLRLMFGRATQAFLGPVPCILPVVWLITFALLQRRLTKKQSSTQN